uniref:sugar transferase n=1 Tax=Limosilactobacillus gastricus TaxID=227942 RepID=UPI0026F2D4D0
MEVRNIEIPIIDKSQVESRCVYRFFKRFFDIVFSLIGLFCLFWLFLIIIIWIKIDDRGPVFFSQTRVGKDGKEFKMYKFRSMVTNAEELKHKLMKQNEVDGAIFKMKDDPRITKAGKFIRKTSLDELPQLWNVLIGDMSLVGPRPPLPAEVAHYSEHDMQRLMVKPGCTGLWQVTARNTVGFKDMVGIDLTYIQRA